MEENAPKKDAHIPGGSEAGFQENDLVEEDSIVLRDSESIGSYLVFKLDDRLFKFRGSQMPAGQYCWNFTFQIPESKTPSSF